jgi:hypothetical protein
MNRLHALARLVAALLAFSAGTAAAAQIFKWVDERGVVNYSNQPPADPKSAKNVREVEDRVSVYTPDPALVRAMDLFRQRASEAAYERLSAPPAVVMLGAASPSPTMVHAAYGNDFPFWVGGGYWGHRPPLHKVPQIKLRPGAIAGNMVENGLIAGNTVQRFPPPPVSGPPFDPPRPTPHGGRAWRR